MNQAVAIARSGSQVVGMVVFVVRICMKKKVKAALLFSFMAKNSLNSETTRGINLK
jgi:hypothetical protein